MALDYNPSGLPKEDLTPVYNMPTPRSVICERETEAFILSHKNHLLNETRRPMDFPPPAKWHS